MNGSVKRSGSRVQESELIPSGLLACFSLTLVSSQTIGSFKAQEKSESFHEVK
jgi:hypothetical protein